ncbi:ferredoxin C 2, chloroplastic isoform X2 [Cryptomeria japonica]|uniref:ferredoxin C 2, chloroplastic isoform X2 n=1 Tax=Cryptomeria japonica TaxID=3369 RepID=UPI0025AC1BF8|nr:ferredoxin C 2, chloroplastic isoform X2 [Cryptomeria japonica]
MTMSMAGLLQQPSCSYLFSQPTIQTSFRNSGKSISSVINGNRICRTRALTELQENGIPPNTTIAGQVPNQYVVTVYDKHRGITHKFQVPEDQYILQTAEAQDISLPFACRHGCCTTCAVRVKSGVLRQPEALGISSELKSKGYALLCVGFPASDLEVETQDEDEVYWLQFGRYFARGPIEHPGAQAILHYQKESKKLNFFFQELLF